MTSYEAILNRMLERIPDSMDKREGSIIYDALAPAAAELSLLYDQLTWTMDQIFVDTAEREALILRAKERGLSPAPARATVAKGEFAPSDVDIPIGSRFNLDELNYAVSEKISNGAYKLVCETPGAYLGMGDLIPINYIQGLQTAAITEILIKGEEEEDTESFRSRYLDSFASFAFGGNIADYKYRVKLIQGVGGVKVIPHWDGGGTVKIIFVSAEYDAPSTSLVDYVQTEIDPTQNAGLGYGLAPIGHIVTVQGATTVQIDLSAKLTLETGYSFIDIKLLIEEALDQHYQDLVRTWEDQDNVIVRLAALNTILLAVDRVIDVEDLTINGLAKNYVVSPEAIPERGAFNVT